MSLINDALKRAKEADNKGTPPQAVEKPVTAKTGSASPPEPAMRPVEKAPHQSFLALYALAGALVIVLMCAVAMVWMWNKSSTATPGVASNLSATSAAVPPVPASIPPPSTASPLAAPVPVPAPSPAPVLAATPPPAPVPVVQPTSPPASVAKEEPVAATQSTNASIAAVEAPVSNAVVEVVAPVVPPPPQFPTLKLQGIFYNASKPSTVINGKTYFTGNTVAGARIVQIEAEKVTVEWNGETRVLETAQ